MRSVDTCIESIFLREFVWSAEQVFHFCYRQSYCLGIIHPEVIDVIAYYHLDISALRILEIYRSLHTVRLCSGSIYRNYAGVGAFQS